MKTVFFFAALIMADGSPKVGGFQVPTMEDCQKEIVKFDAHNFPGEITARYRGCVAAEGEAQ